jgi:hypothetical protein
MTGGGGSVSAIGSALLAGIAAIPAYGPLDAGGAIALWCSQPTGVALGGSRKRMAAMESLGLRAMRGYFVVMSPGENENEKMVVPG